MKKKGKAERLRAEAEMAQKARTYGLNVGTPGKAVRGDKEMQDLTRIAKNGEQYLLKMKALAGVPSRKESAFERV